jgi:hypothetical protein
MKPASLFGAGGAIATLIVDGLYLAAIAQQGVTPPGGRVVFVAAWIGAAAAIGLAGAFVRPDATRALLLGGAAAMLVAIGVPAIFSFGGALLLCAAVVAAGAIRAAEVESPHTSILAAVPVMLLACASLGVAAGFALTEF